MKLKEKSAELSSSASPVPSPDYDAPSPAGSGEQNLSIEKGLKFYLSGDEMEIRLPDEQAGEVGSSNRRIEDKSKT